VKGFLLWALTATVGVLTLLVLLLGTVDWPMMTTDHHAEEAAKGELYLTYIDYDEFYGAERQSPRERATWHMTAYGRR
jgi:hypothetical protein